ncbi:MAG: hypothetical protein Q9210_003795 [Variospora velana]
MAATTTSIPETLDRTWYQSTPALRRRLKRKWFYQAGDLHGSPLKHLVSPSSAESLLFCGEAGHDSISTMRAVIFKGPRTVAVEDRPVPKIEDERDIIVKVIYSALCGSELHVFRGHQPSPTGFIMGHEFTATADSTVVKVPEEIADNALLLMADIFPTGYFAAHNAFKDMTKEQVAGSMVVVIGCGPVGLCALINAEDHKPKNLLAVNSVQSRLGLAKSLGGEPWNFQTDSEGLDKRIKELIDGRGADVVIEVVGLSPAMKTAFELLRP